ncbi:MAG: hypothetical protein AAF609_03530 [Cyanobacteria bacterium P01_C01_bin.120]
MATGSKDSQQSPSVPQPTHISGASSVVISLLTGPLLVTLMACRTFADALTQAGIASEELFRGERLPNLQTSPPAEHQPSDPTYEE